MHMDSLRGLAFAMAYIANAANDNAAQKGGVVFQPMLLIDYCCMKPILSICAFFAAASTCAIVWYCESGLASMRSCG